MIYAPFCFGAAFILTRPLGATLGDLLDKPLADGGLEIDRLYASAVLAALMIACILLFEQSAGGIMARQSKIPEPSMSLLAISETYNAAFLTVPIVCR